MKLLTDMTRRLVEAPAFEYTIVGTFVVINLFIAIIINNLDEAKLERLRDIERPVLREELLRDIRATQDALHRLEARLDDDREEG